MMGRNSARGIIRPLEERDEAAANAVIRAVRREFGVTGEGFDSHEPELPRLHARYRKPRSAYYVVDLDGCIEGGGGIAPYGAADSPTCELQRMDLAPGARRAGYGRALLLQCLDAARAHGYGRADGRAPVVP